MSTDEDTISLRVRISSKDDPVIVDITRPGMPENGLQTLGDWVLAALEQHADSAASAARAMVAALRERDWEGDVELADQLDALLASGVIPDLRPLPLDLEQLSGILEGDPMNGNGRIDLRTGDVWPEPAFDYGGVIREEDEEDEEDEERWLRVRCDGSRDGYRDMERFIGTVRDPVRADLLDVAITGRGAFRRFRDVLERWPEEVERWHAFSTERERGRARAWLAAAGYYVRIGEVFRRRDPSAEAVPGEVFPASGPYLRPGGEYVRGGNAEHVVVQVEQRLPGANRIG
jgi:hypothetical protein